jgi:hypothetical protein
MKSRNGRPSSSGYVLGLNWLSDSCDHAQNDWMNIEPSRVRGYVQAIRFFWIKPREEMVYVAQKRTRWYMEAHVQCADFTRNPGKKKDFYSLPGILGMSANLYFCFFLASEQAICSRFKSLDINADIPRPDRMKGETVRVSEDHRQTATGGQSGK